MNIREHNNYDDHLNCVDCDIPINYVGGGVVVDVGNFRFGICENCIDDFIHNVNEIKDKLLHQCRHCHFYKIDPNGCDCDYICTFHNKVAYSTGTCGNFQKKDHTNE